MKQFFRRKYKWEPLYYHYQKQCKDGNWQKIGQILLCKYKHLLDMSSIQLDGTHTPTKRGGEAVAYQGRKKSKTGNMIILTDNQGIPLSCSEPISGNHNDAFELVPGFKTLLAEVQSAGIATCPSSSFSKLQNNKLSI
jgi:hypothetical protein